MTQFQGVEENAGIIEGDGPVAESVQFIPNEQETESESEKSDAQIISEKQEADEQGAEDEPKGEQEEDDDFHIPAVGA